VRLGGRATGLAEWIAEDPEGILGRRVRERFGDRLPFLLKVLAAEKPLSIQAHPDRSQAREGFARENALGIPLDAPERSYRDASPKPEILCALTPFQALCGFRPPARIEALLERLSAPSLDPERAHLRDPAKDVALRGFLAGLLRMPRARRAQVLDECSEAASMLRDEDPAFDWLLRLRERHSGDPGVLAPLFLELVELRPGQALFLEAGCLHCYLGGVGVELMASSDNVLRGGLTSKHVDPDELLRVLRFEAGRGEVLEARGAGPGVFEYATPAPEFRLTRLELSGRPLETLAAGRGIEILLCTEGALRVAAAGAEALPLPKGAACVVPASAGAYSISGSGRAFRASVPA
jgi:mannose-6-phosphate isomerase